VCADRDEPISDIAGPAIAALPRSARNAGVPVLLTGIGGDELFWGYDWMRQLAAWMTTYLSQHEHGHNVTRPRFSPKPTVLHAQVDWLLTIAGLTTDWQMRRFVSSGFIGGSVPLPYYEFQPGHRQIGRAMKSLSLNGAAATVPEFYGLPESVDIGAAYTIMSNETYLRVNSFVQVDRLSMKYSIESRTPLADSHLVAKILSGRLASREHMAPPKSTQRELAHRFLPQEIVNRPKKGFTPPVREWAKAVWQHNNEVLVADACIGHLGMNPTETQKWIRQPITRSGRVNQIALRLLTLELWIRSL
jgi:asparagine synthase (glutamine-hydrolysing)